MNAFLRRVMEIRQAEQMEFARTESECRRCEGCGKAFRNMQKPLCRPCEMHATVPKTATVEFDSQSV